MKWLAIIAVLFTGALLLYATGDFPAWGDSESPANDSPVSKHYIEESIHETEVPNMVTAVLADYRSYDTMFETVVIFVAGIGIIAVLGKVAGSEPADPAEKPDMIIVVTCRLVIPVLQLFALYVVAHGHHSPGGGFQGGVMLGASFILLALACGLQDALTRISENRAILLAGIGILIYAGTGLLNMFLGGNFLDYEVLHKIMPATDEVAARSHSMMIVEIGVAFTVTAIMFAIYAYLSSGGKLKGGL